MYVCVIDTSETDNSQPVPSSSTQNSTISHWLPIWMEEMWERQKMLSPGSTEAMGNLVVMFVKKQFDLVQWFPKYKDFQGGF